jgi:DNA polymerase-3 subunit delta
MSYKRFLEDIKKESFKRIYLFHGDERYLMEKMITQAKALIVNEAFEDFNYQLIDGETADFDSVLQAMETLPLMQDQKLIVVKNAPYFKQTTPSEAQTLRYKRLLSDEQASYVVIFQCSEGVDKRKKLYKDSLEKGAEIEFVKLDAKDFEKWMQRLFKEHKIEVPGALLSVLVEILGYLDYHSTKNLYHIEGELKQLCDYVGSGVMTKDQIHSVLRKSVEGNIFVVIDAFSDGDQTKAMTIIEEMLLYGEPEIKILFMLARHFRQLNRVRTYLDGGYGADSIGQEMKLQRFQLQKLIKQSRGLSQSAIGAMLQKIEKADHAIKSGGMSSKVALDFVLGHFYLLYSKMK